jgi:polysaccharide export outer membrane protein
MTLLIRIAVLIKVSLILLAAPTASAQEAGAQYTLAPNDRIEVTVYGLPNLSGEFRVSVEGTVALPLAGEVVAAGSTAAELASRISEQLRPLLAVSPNTTVSVLSRRPVYVLGGVADTGAYEYEPGMRVLHLLAHAGGLRVAPLRTDNTALQRIAIEAELARNAAELQRLQLERARLLAERDSVDDISAPIEVDTPLDPSLVAQEQQLLDLRVRSLERAVALFEEQKDEYRRELEALAEQAESKRDEMALISELLAAQEQLLERGLVPRESLLDLQRQVLAEQAALNEIAAFEARARQSILRIDMEIADLRSARLEEVLSEIRDNLERTAIIRSAIAEAELSLQQLGALAPAIGAATFTIQRESDGSLSERSAFFDTLLDPGDILVVELPSMSPMLDFATDGAPYQAP